MEKKLGRTWTRIFEQNDAPGLLGHSLWHSLGYYLGHSLWHYQGHSLDWPPGGVGKLIVQTCSDMSRLDLYYFFVYVYHGPLHNNIDNHVLHYDPPIQNSIYSPQKSKITWIFKLVNLFFDFYFLTDNFLSLASYYYCITKCKVCFYPIRLVCNIQFS